jgi:hypothetical protein
MGSRHDLKVVEPKDVSFGILSQVGRISSDHRPKADSPKIAILNIDPEI